jgi:hypothetical protein
MGFVQTVQIVGLLRFFEPIAPLVITGVTLVSLIAAWLGVSEAHRLRGLRTLALPVLYVLILVVGVFALDMLFAGLEFSLTALAQRFGIMP